jgi:hypothetical protein
MSRCSALSSLDQHPTYTVEAFIAGAACQSTPPGKVHNWQLYLAACDLLAARPLPSTTRCNDLVLTVTGHNNELAFASVTALCLGGGYQGVLSCPGPDVARTPLPAQSWWLRVFTERAGRMPTSDAQRGAPPFTGPQHNHADCLLSGEPTRHHFDRRVGDVRRSIGGFTEHATSPALIE